MPSVQRLFQVLANLVNLTNVGHASQMSQKGLLIQQHLLVPIMFFV